MYAHLAPRAKEFDLTLHDCLAGLAKSEGLGWCVGKRVAPFARLERAKGSAFGFRPVCQPHKWGAAGARRKDTLRAGQATL